MGDAVERREVVVVQLDAADGQAPQNPEALTGDFMVGLPGFEPGTSASRTQRANQAAPQPVRLPREAGQPP
jgi:hypothetical protein